MDFKLTLQEFRNFCSKTKYLTRKGRCSGYCGIDRIDPEKGYEVGNIQVLEVGQNTRKALADKRTKEKCPEYNYEDVPF